MKSRKTEYIVAAKGDWNREIFEKYKIPVKQNGDESFYKKRDKKDSKLNIDKTIRDQFNLLRIVNNSDYPAYFELDGNRYTLKVELDYSSEVE